ncbi:FAD-dependent monooxygenase [Streptomyces europaeiscabiei]|uniref:FAD-dependent monooxygenase n=1 Tax=Streptomyces europaeiscabiei TaxID=146819 RepID=UPI0029AF53E9|nr:FAD-dependent monooxygenase [Streptomyces europaeiscabiei]MDX3613635.1 FAD-dependent monooxygenase [Streptomyces europaeiscabiei]MDX3637433.1 FAD-dependent monooxygenase [Streptomyces europaeiscabiei]MDX3652952.1 FAD-dependent monooxygenase [Streptomyces europaeiscabiei]WUD29999.1 FAD-dependent monooxygenase [Streptomyces europaeiscabiei]WUD38143.1 FAD-dependent monooxygenase [Streptomyces europaeiscabiei]
MPKRHAVVAGAGIGGLTAAVALHRRGWHVTVCERAPEPPATGAGIGLAPNALRALDTIGVDAARAAGSAVPTTMGVRRSDGQWLTRTDTADMAARYGMPPIAVPRPAFTAALAASLPPEALRYGTAVTAVDDAAGRPTIRTAVGPDLPADLVVAADGIHSPLRRAYFPAHPGLHYIGETAWRTIVDAPDLRIPAMSETWGRGERFGVTPLSDGRFYLYATAVLPAGTRSADPRAELRRRFGSWHDPIPALLDRIRRLDPADVLQNDLYDLAAPLPTLHHGRIAWLGDAAHAMAPNLGQGGCQAIEDAVLLAHLLPAGDSADGTDSTDSVPAALAAYTAARRGRTDAVRVRARRVGRLGALRNPLVVAARDLAVRATPARLALHAMDDLFNGFRLPG